MRLLLITGADDNYDTLYTEIQPLGYEVIRYRHVLKAMDNIDEIDPSAIIISARDFPRHWKLLAQFIRSARTETQCPIILLKGDYFSDEEISKAHFLGISGIADHLLESRPEIDSILTILRRDKPSPSSPHQPTGMLIADLCGKTIIAGTVTAISAKGLSFCPGDPSSGRSPAVETALPRGELRECSLRLGGEILSPICRVSGDGTIIKMEFVSLTPEEQLILDRYLKTVSA